MGAMYWQLKESHADQHSGPFCLHAPSNRVAVLVSRALKNMYIVYA